MCKFPLGPTFSFLLGKHLECAAMLFTFHLTRSRKTALQSGCYFRFPQQCVSVCILFKMLGTRSFPQEADSVSKTRELVLFTRKPLLWILLHLLTFCALLNSPLSGPYPQNKTRTTTVKFQWPNLMNTCKSFLLGFHMAAYDVPLWSPWLSPTSSCLWGI